MDAAGESVIMVAGKGAAAVLEPENNLDKMRRKKVLAAYVARYYRPEVLERPKCYGGFAPMASSAMEVSKEKRMPRAGATECLVVETDAGFSETLLKLIAESGKKESEVYTRANLSRQHFSKIRSNPDYRPTKTTALALAIALELDLSKTNDLIGRAGYVLTRSSKLDVIVMYFLREGCYDLQEINEALYEYDQSLLGM